MFFIFNSKSQEPDENGENQDNNSEVDPEFSMESGAWEENFKSAHDTKPNGPEAVALDFSFPQAVVAYGLPEHADSFALKSSKYKNKNFFFIRFMHKYYNR